MAIASLKIKGLRKWQKALESPRMDAALRRNMRVASGLNGKLAEARVRRVLQNPRGAGKFDDNAALTQAIKGSAKPLTDRGTLFQAVTSKVEDDFTVFVGILRTSRSFNVALAVHEGFEAKVTAKMRGLFWVLWQASAGAIPVGELTGRAAELYERMPGGWKPLSTGTTVIVTPRRPFIETAFASKALTGQVKRNWQQAIQQAFREVSK